VFAYLLIVAGLFWVAIRTVLRDSNQLECNGAFFAALFACFGLIYGGVILTFTFRQY